MNIEISFDDLQEAEAKYRGMFENAVEGIYQSTPDGRYLTVNAALARLYGYDRPEELLNQVSDIQHEVYVNPTMREQFRREIESAGFVRGLEYQVRRRDGRIIWISESARMVCHPNGSVRYYEGFIDDITARKEAEAESARLEKQRLQAQKLEAIGMLAGGMVHDFNNILCAVSGYTELSLSDQKISSQTRENLNAVLNSARRAKDLIGRILTFSRPTETARYPIKFSAILTEGVKLLNAILPASITVNLAIRTDVDVVVADATELHQIIMNLGTNAKHAMNRRGGRLDYELELVHFNPAQAKLFTLPAGSYVHLMVRDTGHGMPREIIDGFSNHSSPPKLPVTAPAWDWLWFIKSSPAVAALSRWKVRKAKAAPFTFISRNPRNRSQPRKRMGINCCRATAKEYWWWTMKSPCST